jgi:hypothetical protein
MLVERICRICGKPFRTRFKRIELCNKCWKKQPKCGSCKQVMAMRYGGLERFAGMVGKKRICASCAFELSKNGFLRISETQILLPDGKVKTAGPLEIERRLLER